VNNDNTKQDKNNWHSLWQAFDVVIASKKEQQEGLIKKITASNKILGKQLKELIQAHYSSSSLLDSQPQWVNEFRQSFKPPLHIRGYKILQKLGAGGIGDVYLASKIDDGFERKVAIKFATTGRFAEHVLESFNTELKMLLSLNHPNIERLYDGGITQDNIPFLIVEYIDGTHVDEYCDLQGLNLYSRLKLFQKICHAVDVVHRSLIIHRDIKSGNIMITEDGEPKLLDFGLAKIVKQNKLDETITYSSKMMTLAYASPEQVNGTSITTASDVYSLGVLLYYLLTGNMPYTIDKNNLSSTIKTINEYTPKPISNNINATSAINKHQAKLKNKLKRDLELIVNKSLSKQADKRYQSASEFSQDIQNYLENRPISAKKETFFYRINKFIKRNKMSLGLATFTFMTLIALVISLTVQTTHLKNSMIEIQQQQSNLKQVTSFLKEIFILSDPLKTDAKLLNVKDLLDSSSNKLETQFKQQPQTKAMLYNTLGNVYLNMSLLSQAQQLFDKAEALYSITNSSKGLFQLKLDKIDLLHKQSHYKVARLQLDELTSKDSNSELNKQYQSRIQLLFGQNYYFTGKTNKAKDYLQKSLNSQQKSNNKNLLVIAETNRLLGNVYWRLGDFKKVKQHYQKSYQINKTRLGENHHKTIISLSSIGVLEFSQGNYEQALDIFQIVTEAHLNRLGQHHQATAQAFNYLGATYFELGHLAEAEKALNKALEAYESLQLSHSMHYARTLNNIALIERRFKKYQQAQQTFLRVKAIELENLGKNHIELASITNNLGLVAADLNEFENALDLFKESYDTNFANNQENNANIAYSMTNICRMYLQLNLLNEAKDWSDRALKIRKNKLPKNNIQYIESLAASASIDLAQGNRNSAKEKLEKVLNIRNQKLPNDDWRISEAALLLASVSQTELESINAEKLNVLKKHLSNLSSQLGNSHYRFLSVVDILRKSPKLRTLII